MLLSIQGTRDQFKRFGRLGTRFSRGKVSSARNPCSKRTFCGSVDVHFNLCSNAKEPCQQCSSLHREVGKMELKTSCAAQIRSNGPRQNNKHRVKTQRHNTHALYFKRSRAVRSTITLHAICTASITTQNHDIRWELLHRGISRSRESSPVPSSDSFADLQASYEPGVG